MPEILPRPARQAALPSSAFGGPWVGLPLIKDEPEGACSAVGPGLAVWAHERQAVSPMLSLWCPLWAHSLPAGLLLVPQAALLAPMAAPLRVHGGQQGTLACVLSRGTVRTSVLGRAVPAAVSRAGAPHFPGRPRAVGTE